VFWCQQQNVITVANHVCVVNGNNMSSMSCSMLQQKDVRKFVMWQCSCATTLCSTVCLSASNGFKMMHYQCMLADWCQGSNERNLGGGRDVFTWMIDWVVWFLQFCWSRCEQINSSKLKNPTTFKWALNTTDNNFQWQLCLPGFEKLSFSGTLRSNTKATTEKDNIQQQSWPFLCSAVVKQVVIEEENFAEIVNWHCLMTQHCQSTAIVKLKVAATVVTWPSADDSMWM